MTAKGNLQEKKKKKKKQEIADIIRQPGLPPFTT